MSGSFRVEDKVIFHDDQWVTMSLRVATANDGSGRTMTYGFTHVKNGGYVSVCGRTTAGLYIMTRQFRMGVGGMSLGFVNGFREGDETWQEAARREMRSEVHYEPGRLVAVGTFMPMTDRCDNRCHLFVAFDCVPVAPEPRDEVQSIEILLMTEAEVRAALESGEIVSMTAALGFQAHLLQA